MLPMASWCSSVPGALGFVGLLNLTLSITVSGAGKVLFSWSWHGGHMAHTTEKDVEGPILGQCIVHLGVAFVAAVCFVVFWTLSLTLGRTAKSGFMLGLCWCQAEWWRGSHVVVVLCSPWHTFYSCNKLGALGFVDFWTLTLGVSLIVGGAVKGAFSWGLCATTSLVLMRKFWST